MTLAKSTVGDKPLIVVEGNLVQHFDLTNSMIRNALGKKMVMKFWSTLPCRKMS